MQSRIVSALLVMLPALIGCGGDTTGPFVDPVVGTYRATLMTNTQADSTVDLVAIGLTFAMTLQKDGSMVGQFVFTTGNDRPGTPSDLSGTWQRTDEALAISDIANTFVSHPSFTIHGEQLVGEGLIGESTIRMVLDRED